MNPRKVVLAAFFVTLLGAAIFFVANLRSVSPAAPPSDLSRSAPLAQGAVPSPTSPPSPSESAPPPAAEPSEGREEVPAAPSDSGHVEGRLLAAGPVTPEARVSLTLKNPMPETRDLASRAMAEAFSNPSPMGGWDSLPVPDPPADTGLTARARPDGSFSIPVPRAAREYWVKVEADLHYPESAPRVRTDAEGNATGVRVRLLPGGRLEGRVLDPQEKPVRDAKVRLSGSFNPLDVFSGKRIDHSPGETKTDGEGRFVLGGLRPAKDLALSATSEGFGPAIRRGIEVVAGRSLSVDLALPPSSAIAGTVQDAGGSPIAGASVRARAGGGGLDGLVTSARTSRSADSAADGSFRIEGLGEGEFVLRAEKAGWRESKPHRARVGSGGSATGVTLVLSEGNAIAGLVLGRDGAPAKGASVRAKFEPSAFMVPDPDAWTGTSGQATSAEDGSFRITGLGKGPFTVKAVTEDGASATAKGVKPGEEVLEFRLRAPGGIAGIVLHAVTEEPVVRFRVGTVKSAFGMEVVENPRPFESEEGAFKLTGLEPGQVALEVEAEGFSPGKVPAVAVKEGETVPGLVVRLQPGAVVRGRVIAAGTGAAVEGAVVGAGGAGMLAFFQSLGSSRPEARSDAEGAFEISGLAPGEVRLTATHEDFANAQAPPVRLDPGSVAEGVEIAMRGGGGVDGFVYGEAGAPAAGWSVIVSTPMATVFRSARSEGNGYFLVKGLSPGAYQVTAMPLRFDEAAAEPEAMQNMMEEMRVAAVDVEEGKIARVLLGAEEGGEGVRVHGKVLSGGRPIQGAFVSATPAGGSKDLQVRVAVSGEDGAYSVERVPPGSNLFNVQRVNAATGGMTMVEIEVEVPKGKEFARDLALPVSSIAGKVLDFSNGEPLEGIRVSLHREDPGGKSPLGGGFFETITSSEGTYRFEGVTPGLYAVAAGGPTLLGTNPGGFGRSIREKVALAEAEEVRGVDFRLRPGGTVVGAVRAPGGDPVAAASVFFRDESGAVVNRLSEIFTDESGSFRAPGLAPGSYRVLARGAGFGFGSADGIRVRAGEETSVSIVLSPGTDLLARVLDAEGKFVPGADAELFDASGERVSGLLGFADILEFYRKGAGGPGEVRVGTFAAGNYRLRVVAAGFKTLEVAVALRGAGEQTVEVRLEKE